MTPTEIEEIKRLLILNYTAGKQTEAQIHSIPNTKGCFAVAMSKFSGNVNAIYLPTLNFNKVKKWNDPKLRDTQNKLIQSVFPELNTDEREFLQTGATIKEWNEMFG